MGRFTDALGMNEQPLPSGGGRFAQALGMADENGKPDVGWWEGFARHAAQGATFGFGDEIEGAIRAIGDGTYDEGVALARERNQAAPTSAKIAGTVTGSLAVPGLGLGNVIARGATTGARLARGAGVGAAEGGLAGFGAGEGNAADRLDDAAVGAALGAPLGAAGGLLTRAAEKSAPSTLPLTKGQRTGDFKQLAKEETLRKTGSGTIQNFDARQAKAIEEQAGALVPGGGSVAEEAIRASDELGSVRDVMKGQERAAYQAFEDSEGFLRKDAVMDLHHRLVGVMDDPTKGRALDPDVRKRSAGTLGEIRDLMTPRPGVEHITLQQVEGVRKALNTAINGADGAYKSAMIAVKKEYDEWMESAVSSALYSGDPAALAKLKDARGISSRYRQIFDQGRGDTAGKMINKLIGDDASPEESINMLFGMRKIGKGGTAQALKRIGQVSPETLTHLQRAGWARMIKDRAGEMKSPRMISKAIDEAIAETPDLMNSLYGPGTVKKMKAFSRELKRTITPQGAMNPSGTSYRLAEMVRGIAGPWTATLGFASGADAVGIGSLLLSGGAKAKDYLTARGAVRAARAASKKPAIAAAAGVPIIAQQTAQPLNVDIPYGYHNTAQGVR